MIKLFYIHIFGKYVFFFFNIAFDILYMLKFTLDDFYNLGLVQIRFQEAREKNVSVLQTVYLSILRRKMNIRYYS